MSTRIRKRWSTVIVIVMSVLVVGLATAITKTQQRYQEATAKSRMWYQILDKLHGAIVLVDGNTGLVIQWSPGAEELFGWTSAETIGSDLGFLMSEKQKVKHVAGLASEGVRERMLKRVVAIDCWAYAKGGRQIHVRASVRGVRAGDRYYYVAIMEPATTVQVVPPIPPGKDGPAEMRPMIQQSRAQK